MSAVLLSLVLSAWAGPDRSQPPEVLPPVPLEQPSPEEWDARPGLHVMLVTVPGVRKVSAGVYLHRGSLDLDGGPSFAAAATGWLQDVATREHSASELEVVEDLTDTDVASSSPGLRRTDVTLETPRENLAAGFALLGEVLREPKYPGSDTAQYKALRRHWYTTEAPTSLDTVASLLLDQGWYPADTAYGDRPDLFELDGLTRADLVARHARLLAESPATVLVVGDVTRADLEPVLAEALAGVGVDGVENEMPEFTATAGVRLLAADMPGQEQASVMMRKAAPARHAADRVTFEVLDWALGGHFMSRLNGNLREEKGFTYGAGSWYQARPTYGAWSVGTTVKAENVGATITEIAAEVAEVAAGGVTDGEIDAAWKEWVGSWNTTRQTASTAFGFYASLFESDLTVSRARAELDEVDALDAKATRDVAARWLSAETPTLWVVAGDRAIIEPQLQALGLPVQWVTPEQAVLGSF